MEQELSWDYVKNNILTKQKKCISIDDINKDTSGLLQIKVENTNFEGCLIPSQEKKLYVFLAGYNCGDNYPEFKRISWCDKFVGYKLFMDDPTRVEKHFSPSYFFGDKDKNYLEYVQQIILKIVSVNKIPKKNIVFIASSNCGFASLYLADRMPRTKCIALNPQIDLRLLCGKSFGRAMDIDVNDIKYFDRLNVSRILENRKSKFFIFFNMLSDMDKVQAELIFKQKPVPLGLTKLSRHCQVLCGTVDAVDRHMVQPDEYFCSVIELLMDMPITKISRQIYTSFIGEMKRYFWRGKEIEQLKKSIS